MFCYRLVYQALRTSLEAQGAAEPLLLGSEGAANGAVPGASDKTAWTRASYLSAHRERVQYRGVSVANLTQCSDDACGHMLADEMLAILTDDVL
jgi:hypothetical protein